LTLQSRISKHVSYPPTAIGQKLRNPVAMAEIGKLVVRDKVLAACEANKCEFYDKID